MKKLLIATVVLASSFGFASADSVLAAPANPGSATVNCQNGTGNLSFAGQIGDTFDITNSFGGGACEINGLAGKATPSGQGYSAGMGDGYVMSNGLPATFTITGAGTFTLSSGGGALYNVTVMVGGAMGPSGLTTVVKGSFDPNGGDCIFVGQRTSAKHNFFTVGYSYAPGAAECTRQGYVFTDWMVAGSSPSTSAGLPVLVDESAKLRRHFVAVSGDYAAKWEKATSFDLGGGSCLIDGAVRNGWFDVLTDDEGKSRATNDFVRLPSPDFCTKEGFTLSGWTVDGEKNSFGEIAAVVGATYVANWDTNTPTITIIGSRDSVDVSLGVSTCASYVAGPPPRTLPTGCVVVEGVTTGLAAGTEVTPEYRFPGQTSYTTGIPIKVDANGEFTWYRKTGKKIYVRFVVGDVVSNRVIIQAK